MSYKIAVASGDGKVVNRHFGKADRFYILQVEEDESFHALEIRKVIPICQNGGHSEEALDKNAEILSDCRYVLTSGVGTGAEKALNKLGISVYVIPDIIEAVVKKIVAFERRAYLEEYRTKEILLVDKQA